MYAWGIVLKQNTLAIMLQINLLHKLSYNTEKYLWVFSSFNVLEFCNITVMLFDFNALKENV